ncbi:hypothetical protein ACFL16_00375 [Patescibacteria group bacterium]
MKTINEQGGLSMERAGLVFLTAFIGGFAFSCVSTFSYKFEYVIGSWLAGVIMASLEYAYQKRKITRSTVVMSVDSLA